MNLSTQALLQRQTHCLTAADLERQRQLSRPGLPASHRPLWFRRLARAFTALFIAQTVLAAVPAWGQLSATPGAVSGQKPLIDAAANGVPIVHIAPPSAAGVSRNQYQQFNVSEKGLILNNSTGNVQTQLGGWITGNLQLGLVPARIILNEVTGPDASQLRGTIEVAGHRANIVIANPNGIVCDGCGFLNTSGRATLVTGQAQTGAGGALTGFDIGNGSIQIGAGGLNAASLEQLDLIARGLVIEGEVWAQNLNAIAGVNKVLYGTLEVIAQLGAAAGTAPRFAVDIKQLGGMYANQIYLVATENGLGVNSTGRLAALQGNLALSAAGDLTVKDAYAKGDVRLTASDRLRTTGDVVADAAVRISAPVSFSNSGTVQAGSVLAIETAAIANQGLLTQRSRADLVIQASGGLRNDGTIFAPGNLRVDASEVRGTGGQMLAGARLRLDARTVDLERQTLFVDSDLRVRADAVRVANATVQAGGALMLDSGGRLDLGGSTLDASGAATLTGVDVSLDRVRASVLGDLSVRAGGAFTAQQSDMASNGAIDLRGARFDASHSRLQSQKEVLLQSSGGVALDGAQVVSATRIAVQGQGISTAGAVLSAPTVSVQAGAGALNNRSGRLLATSEDSGALTVKARGIDNQGGEIRANGGLALDAGGATVDNTGGAIAGRSGDLRGIGGLINRGGTLFTSNDLHLAGIGLDNDGGTIASDGSLSVGSAGQTIRNTGGTLQAGGSLSLDSGGGDATSAGGTLSARGAVSLRGAAIDLLGARLAAGQNASIQAGTLQAGGATLVADGGMQIAVQGDAALAGASVSAGGSIDARAASVAATGATIAAGGQLQLATGQLNGGLWSAGGDLAVTATGMADVTGGGFTAGGNVSVRAQGITTDHARVAGQNVQLDAGAGAFSNVGGAVIALGSQGDSLRVRGQGIRNAGGTLVSAGGAVLDANGQTLDNTGGIVQVEGTLQLHASQLLNRGGTLATGSSLSLQGQALDNTGGTIMTRGNLTIDTQGRVLDNTGGRLLAQGDVSIAAGTLRNAGGTIAADGAATVRADTLDTSLGRITGARAMDVLVTQRLTADGALLASGGAVRIAAQDVDAAAATVQAGAGLGITAARALDLTGAMVTTLGPQAGVLEVQAQSIQADGATLRGDADVRVRSAGLLTANAARLSAGGALTLNAAQGNLLLDGAEAFANGRLQLAGNAVNANNAVLDTRAQLEVTARSGATFLNAARLTAGGTLDVQGIGIEARAADIGATGSVGLLAGVGAFAATDVRVRSTAGAVTVLATSIDAAASQAPAAGQLPRTGFMAGQGLVVTATGGGIDLTQAAAVAGADLALQAQGAISTRGGVAVAGGRATLSGTTLNNQGGVIDAAGALSITVNQGTVDNIGGRIATRGALAMQGAGGAALQSLANRQGTVETSDSLDLRLNSFDNQGGSVVALGDLSVRGGPVDNRAGTLAARGAVSVDTLGGAFQGGQGRVLSEQADVRIAAAALNLEGAQVRAQSNVVLSGTQAQADRAAIVSQSGDIALNLNGGEAAFNNSQLLAGGALMLQAGRTSLDGARLSSGQVTTLITNALSARDARVDAQGNLTASAAGAIDARGATFAAGSNGTFNATQGIALDAGSLTAQTIALNAGAGAVGNTGGSLVATGTATLALQVAGQGMHNAGGQMRSGGGLVVDAGIGAIDNAAGMVMAVAGASLRGNGLDNQGGVIAANGELAIAAAVSNPLAVMRNAGGDIRSAQGGIVLTAGEMHNAPQGALVAGQIAAAGDLNITTAGALDNAGAMLSAGRDLWLTAGGAIANGAGRLLAGRDAAVTGSQIGNRSGLIAANRNLAITTASSGLDNTQGRLQAVGDLSLAAAGDVANQNGAIAAGRALTLAAQALDNRQGQLTAQAGNAVLTLASLDNTASNVQAGGDLRVTTSGALQAAGSTLTSGGQMALRSGAADLTDARLVAGASLQADATVLEAARLDAQAGGSLTLNTGNGALALQSANLRANQAVNLSGGAVNLRSAQLAANTAVAVRGVNIDATSATLQSPGDISAVAANTLHFAGARMTAGQDLEARGTGAGTSAGAQLLAGRDLSVGNGAAFDFAGPGFDYQYGRDLTVRAQGIRSAGQQISARNLTLDAGGGLLDNTGGTLQASGAMSLGSQGLANRGGQIMANGDLSVQAGLGAVDNAGARIYSTQGALSLAGGAIDNGGGLLSAATDLTIAGQSLNNTATTIAAGRNLTVQLNGLLSNSGGKLVANQGSVFAGANGIDNTSGTISGAASADVRAGSGTLDNRGGVIAGSSANASGAFVNNAGGVISGLQAASVSGARIANDAGVIEAGAGGIAISTQGQLSNTSSGAFRGIVSTGSIGIDAGSLNNATGYIGAGGGLNISTGAIDNRAGTLSGLGASSVAASGIIDNRGGAITSAADLSVTAASLDNSGQSVVFAGNNLTVSAGHVDNSGTKDGGYRLGLLAGGNLAINSTTLNNSNGAIVALGDATVRATTGIDNRAGQIAGNSVTVETPDLLNTGGRVDAQQRLTLRVQRFSADGTVASNGSLELETTGDYTNTGTVAANGDLAVRTTGSYTNLGIVSAQRNLSLTAGNLTNEAGAAIVSQSTTLNVAGTLLNRGLINSSAGATTIGAGAVQNADRIYGNGVTLNGAVTNAAGAVIASRAGTVSINGSLSNTDGAEVLALGDINVQGGVFNRNAMLNATGNIAIGGSLQNLNGGLVLGTENRTEAVSKLYIIPAGGTGARYDSADLGWLNHGPGYWVLPSGSYPIPSFGVDHKQRAIAQSCIGNAEQGQTCEDVYVYEPQDPIWALFNIPRPGSQATHPGAPPSPTGCMGSEGSGENATPVQDMTGACGTYWAQLSIYLGSVSTSHIWLDSAITAFNNDVSGRTLIDWFEQEITRRETIKPTVLASLPGMVFAGSSISAGGGQSVDSSIAAGGAVSLGFLPEATFADQSSTEFGQMRFNQRNFRGVVNGYDRDLSPWQPITGGTTSTPVPLDTLNAPRTAPGSAGNSYAGTAPSAQLPGLGTVSAGSRNGTGTGATTAATQGGNITTGTGTGVLVGNTSLIGPASGTAPGAVQTVATGGVAGASTTGPQTQTGAGANVALSAASDAPLPGSVLAAGVRSGQQERIAGVQTSFATQAAARPVPTVPSDSVVARAASPPAIKGMSYTTATAKGPLNAPASRLFRINAAPGAGYLVETDPAFTDRNRFLGSDWLLNQLGLDPERQLKLYGDGFAEQRLIDDQIFALTGRRYLSGYGDTEAEYQDLLNAGVMIARAYQLTPGVALTAEQMASLTSDIVWLETQTVSLPGGSTTQALVPRVYLRRPVAGDLTPTGSIISGSSIELRSPGGDLNNSGTVYAHGGSTPGAGKLTIEGLNVSNSGTLAGNVISVKAGNDIVNAGGVITGLGNNSTVALSAGRNIALRTITQTTSQSIEGPGGSMQVSRTNVARIATVSADSIALAALGDIDLQGAKVTATNDLTVKAGGNITSATVENMYSLNVELTGTVVQGRSRHYRVDSNDHLGSTLQAGGNVTLNAGKDVVLTATQVKTGGNLSIEAANVIIDAAVNNSAIDVQATGPNNFSRAVTQNQSLALSTLTAGGNLSVAATGSSGPGTSVKVGTGNLTLTGVTATAGGIVSLSANHDIVIEDALLTQTQDTERYSKSKGFLTNTTRTGSSTSVVTASVASSVSGKKIAVEAGNDLGIQGSRLQGRDGVLLSGGRNVVIREAHETESQSLGDSTVKGGLAGNIGFTPVPTKDATARGTESMVDRVVASTVISEQGSVRIQAGAVAALQGVQVLAGKDIAIEAGAVSITGATGAVSTSRTVTDKGTHVGGLGWHDSGKGPGAKETISGQASSSTLTRSTLTGQSVSIIANGKEATSGDLVLSGTTIDAGGTLALSANNMVQLGVQTTRDVSVQGSQGRDIGWQKFTDQGRIDENIHHNQFNVGALTVKADKVEVQIAQPTGAAVDMQTSIRTLAGQPGMAWIGQLQSEPALQGKVNWKQIEEVHKTWNYKQEGLTQEGAIIIALVVAFATQGWGAEAAAALGGSANTVVGVAVLQAGITTLSTQASIALLNNKGNVGAALKELGSSANVRGLITALLTAGVLANIAPLLTQPGNPTAGSTFVNQLQTSMAGGLARAVIASAVNGTSLEEGLKNAIKGALIDTLAAQGANLIGNSKLDGFAHKAAHTIAGCAAGAARTASAGGCTAGAIGAAIGEIAAEFYGDKPGTVEFAALIGGIAAAAAGASPEQINVASAAGSNAAANNYLTREQARAKKKEIENAAAQEDKAAIDRRYDEIDVAQKKDATACILNNQCESVLGKVSLKTTLDQLHAVCAPPRLCTTEEKHSIVELQDLYTKREAITPDTTVEEFLLGNKVVGVVFAAARATIARAFGETATTLAKPLGLVDDFHGNPIHVYEAAAQYGFKADVNITVTGANLEVSATRFVKEEAGKDFIAVFDSKIGTQGIDLAYARMVNGKPQLIIGEAKAGDSALTALGENYASTLTRNLAKVEKSIMEMPDGPLREALRDQIKSRTYQVELYTSTGNAARTASRIDDVLVDRLQQPITRVVTFGRQ